VVDAVRRILDTPNNELKEWLRELAVAHTKANGEIADYSRLQGHLNRYAARHTFDYFIHKNLGDFLRRELDFYIKNEIMHLDDIENESELRVEQYLSKIKVVRKIAHKLIDFLAQLEDFQRTLWLKKKFVVETSYCVALSRIPEEFYSEIAANGKQLEEWVKLYSIDDLGDYADPVSIEFLKKHRNLMIDTQHFSDEFSAKLIATFDNLDSDISANLINGENFAALNLMRRKYTGKVDAIYIDPPYNTDASSILYKNNYKSSSWISLMYDRVEASKDLLKNSGIFCAAIDDEQFPELRNILRNIFPKDIGVAPVRSNPQSRKSRSTLSPSHEYALFYGKSFDAIPGSLGLTDKRLARYPKKDKTGHYSWMSFIRTGTNDRRADRPKMFYPILVNEENVLRIPEMEWSEDIEPYGAYIVNEELKPGEVLVYPVSVTNGSTIEKRWHRGFERVISEPDEYRVRRDNNGSVSIDFKTRIDEESTPITWWDKNEYASANYGAAELKALFGEKPFDFPKAVKLVEDCIRASTRESNALVVDYFAGSGTTGHAVINLNREDGGKRNFSLVEVGHHFDDVILPRIKKLSYSAQWEEGKPKPDLEDLGQHAPQIVRIIRLESYEDAVNNLQTIRSEAQQSMLQLYDAQGPDGVKEQYLLRYMLDVETRGSQSLLDLTAFEDPKAYKLFVKPRNGDESRETNVDLLETFNWLTGLIVKHVSVPQAFQVEFETDSEGRLRLKGRLRQQLDGPWWFRTVTGVLPDGRESLVIWRKMTGNADQDNLVLDEWFRRSGYSTQDYEFNLIYVNGDNNLENLRQPDETWKVRLIEEDFHRLMFDVENV